jgi:hypothetical protein
MKRTVLITLLAISTFILGAYKADRKDEGMFPLSELRNLDLKKLGLKIRPQELYNPSGTSLIDAIVRVGGCTGSFVSEEGLIVTNHHCAFGYVAAISDTAHDYISNGFLASTRQQEQPAKGLVCRITASYEDVSSLVLAGTAAITDPGERVKKINQNIRWVQDSQNRANPTLSCEISEMFTGRTYVLFRYRLLKDVRIVYVPARSIGEYGGEKDNWVWPRHAGDFAFLRAYVAPDGSVAEYNEKNIPYQPAKILKVNPAGVKENDFVFVLGYPGRTYRHKPAAFYRYHQEYMLRYISDLYDWEIEKLEAMGKENKAVEIRYAGTIKSLANVTKNYKGKLQGFRRAGLTAKKYEEENMLQQYINADAKRKAEFGNVIPRINALYDEIIRFAPRNLWYDQIYNIAPMLAVAATIDNYRDAYSELKTKEEKEAFRSKQQKRMKDLFYAFIAKFDESFERESLAKMVKDARGFNKENEVSAISNLTVEEINSIYSKTKIGNKEEIGKLMDEDWDKLFGMNDPLIELASSLNAEINLHDAEDKAREGELNQLMAKYVDAKAMWKNGTFVPDANGTLRFTYGHVKGYSPNDAEYHKPFTTIRGVVEKEDGKDWELMQVIKDLYAKRDFGSLIYPLLNDVPVNILYDLDTTGGNSGSPILNASGELIGVNFDRAYTATINDYAWNESYSRSVGVDIRYVLWIVQKVAKADHLVQEMKLKI